MGLFGKSAPPDPKLQVQEWSKKLRKEGYSLDRQINAIKREEMKVTQSIKMAAKKGDKDSCRLDRVYSPITI
jgi:charged multivesicular body protein 3